jgi:hypothetical protein
MSMNTRGFDEGDDEVTWHSHDTTVKGTVQGTLQDKITSDTTVATHQVRTSDGDPQYRVRDESGRDAVHEPKALHAQASS